MVTLVSRATIAVGVLALGTVPQYAIAESLSRSQIDALPECIGIVPEPANAGRSLRSVGFEDLLRLRDIGFAHLGDMGRAISVSPDGRNVAFILARADPQSNRYCQALLVVSTSEIPTIRVLDLVGQPNYSRATLRGFYSPNGVPAENVPQWSPDGRELAYLKQIGSISQAWEVDLMSGERKPISPLDKDIERVGWVAGGVPRQRPWHRFEVVI